MKRAIAEERNTVTSAAIDILKEEDGDGGTRDSEKLGTRAPEEGCYGAIIQRKSCFSTHASDKQSEPPRSK